MKRSEWLQETLKMRFEEAYTGWQKGRLTQEEAALLLGVCERTFRRYIDRYEDEGLEGLADKRMNQMSHRRAPVDEVLRLVDGYRKRHDGWNAKHFDAWYKRDGGGRSYTWVKKQLQDAELVPKSAQRGKHRKKRERSPLPGMMLHQDGSTHQWVPGQQWDLIVTMDDATNEHYSMFFVDEGGTQSSFRGVRDPVWTGDETVGHRHDCRLFAGGAWAIRKGLCHASGAAAQGAGIGRHHQYGIGK
jgi:transposase